MSLPQNIITNSSEEKEKILTQCTSFLSNHLNPLTNDLSYQININLYMITVIVG